jgi:hypothetical protein
MAFPGTFNINYYEGDTYEFKVYPKNSVGGVFNLSEYSPEFYISNGRGPTVRVNGEDVPVTQFECDADIGIDSTITCTIHPAVGRQLVAGASYVYDVQVTKPGSPPTIHTILTGTVSVTADITGAI